VIDFREIWAVDFEFIAGPGWRPIPVCLVARELRTGRLVRQWCSEFGDRPPYSLDPGSLFVAYFASAELGCHLALDWPLPERVLDLYAEFRLLTNGLPTPCGRGLLGAMTWHGLDGIAAGEKDDMRALVLRGGPWSDAEQCAILDYCQSDVDGLAALLPRMLPAIVNRKHGLAHALLRGRYMAAVARMEHLGAPVDFALLRSLRRHWQDIKAHLVAEVDRDFGVYDGQTFKLDRFAGFLAREDIPWPRLDSGQLALDDDTFREMARTHPLVAPLRELRHALSQLRLHDLAVDPGGRNRTLLSPFGARTGRNTPSNTKYIFGPAVWLRGLIRPDPGKALAYIDYSAQEVGIAAALSGDQAMLEAVRSGDPYLGLSKQAGRAPADATKDTHGPLRDVFKVVVLGTGYGMKELSLSHRLGSSPIEARDLLALLRRTWPTFWRWAEAAVDHAMLYGHLDTVFGWRLHVGADANPRSLRNYPCQGNGAEMLRLACCLATERGIGVCAPVHDALLIEADRDRIGEAVHATRAAMAEASRLVLGGFELSTDVKVIFWPHRYSDPRGEVMWCRVIGILDGLARGNHGGRGVESSAHGHHLFPKFSTRPYHSS
jgi:DNA polymerase I